MKAAKPSKKSVRYLSEDANYWQRHTDALKKSGLSRKNYCGNNNVNYDRFAYWLSKQQPIKAPPMVAIKLKAVSKSPTSSKCDVLCTLELSNGNCLKIYDAGVLSIILERLN